SVVSGTVKPSAILYIIAYAFLLGNKKELPLRFFGNSSAIGLRGRENHARMIFRADSPMS
ncbi:MAG TPA: hypothetical protein H9981_07700, partial [Candidatus Mediterraneibacter caccavium]|nr:hypothetical protein [Candidatus Mediterraneibacter caccavium]